jgi:hypothetical protein
MVYEKRNKKLKSAKSEMGTKNEMKSIKVRKAKTYEG